MSVIAHNPDSTQFTGALTTIVIVVNGLGAGIDVLIALSMVYLLGRRHTKIVRYVSLYDPPGGSYRVATGST
ncbi:hypothetical protein PM082_002862 [Marasmius tenuissimus]|nr:hypothetical protein PM082_002862 [Marasmius tenuissimus]